MKTFSVFVRMSGEFEVEADSPKEAETIAINSLNGCTADFVDAEWEEIPCEN